MLVWNLNIKEKLINGSRGTIVGYVRDENDQNQILAIEVKFDFQRTTEMAIQITRKIVNTY